MLLLDEGCLLPGMVLAGRIAPVASVVGSGELGTSSPTQRATAQNAEKTDLQQHRSARVCRVVPFGSRRPGRSDHCQAGNCGPLAPCRLPSLLALEIKTTRWPAEDASGDSPAPPRDQYRESVLGCAADPWRTPQARHRCRTNHGCQIHGEGTATAVSGVEDLPAQPPDGIASMDLFVVPTLSFRLLHGFLILQHRRREILWLGVTAHPNAEWISRQITEAFGWEQAPRYIVRDRDGVYGEVFNRRVRAMGIRDRPTSPRSPWQNAYAERLIGSIRRDCLDHVVVFGEQHLRHLLQAYQQYYNKVRTHLSVYKDAPVTRAVQPVGRILPRPILGGLHHQYVRT